MSDPTSVGPALRRDLSIVVAGLVAITAVFWVGTIYQALTVHPAHGVAHHPPGHGAHDLGHGMIMWVVMMVAMMVPPAAPQTLAAARIDPEGRSPVARALAFLGGYLVVWTAFSLLAALAQWRLEAAEMMARGMTITSPLAGGVLLVTAGLFQLTPVKDACLRRCRGQFGSADVGTGALRLGLRSGVLSVGSCGGLMLILFVVGVMSLPWMAAITAFLFLETVAPWGRRLARVAGFLLVVWGAWMLAFP